MFNWKLDPAANVKNVTMLNDDDDVYLFVCVHTLPCTVSCFY